MKIFLEFNDNEAKHLKTLEDKQTFLIESEDLELKAQKKEGEILIQIKRAYGLQSSGGDPIFVRLPQNAICANTPLRTTPITGKN